MPRLLLIRHAESTWNAAGRWQGQGDPPLSPHGFEQAAAAVPALRGKVEAVWASSLMRAKQTADVIAGSLGLGEVRLEPDVSEIDVGEWSGLTRNQVRARYPGMLEAWRAGDLDAAPGGEHKDAFLERVLRGIRRIAGEASGPVLVITHGGCIGRLERDLGVFGTRGPGNLSGRWFDVGDELVPDADRVDLLAEWTPPPPESLSG